MKAAFFPPPRRQAFTLVEILIVLAIVAMLLFYTVPGLKDVLRGSKLVTAADQIAADIGIARQTAIKEGVPVEVRFYKFRNPEAKGEERFAAYQCYRMRQDMNSPSDYTKERIALPVFEKLRFIPQGVVLAEVPEWSPLITDQKMKTDRERVFGLVSGERDTEAQYLSFTINPEGETNLDRSGANQWYISLVTEKDYHNAPAIKPDNYIVLQVDPYTANVRRYQPN
jgi:uncharacterized protein (TIGR02596 family)